MNLPLKLLVSVRTPAEALTAAAHGADFIDLKEPGAGALGGLPEADIRAIVAALRGAGHRLPISATVGDWAMADRAAILARVAAVAACGVDIVKVGILAEPGAGPVLRALGACAATVVPVFIADQPLDAELVALALAQPFPGVMADTAEKLGGSLLARRSVGELGAFVRQVQSAGREVGLAGALRLADLPALLALAPDFAGFRSAVCDGDRASALSAPRLAQLVAAVRAIEQAASPATA
jgi:uncharacterized protein (UPF0264 family)